MSRIHLDKQALNDLYTVIFAIDGTGILRHVSPTPCRYIDGLEAGIPFLEHFTFLRPARISTVDDLLQPEHSLFLLKDQQDRFAARGQVVALDWDGERLITFCGSPWLFWMNANCPDVKLGMGDFPPQDSQLDQLFLMTTEQRMVSDLEQLNGELQSAKRETEKAQEAKNALFARMSHEMRTPLNGVVSALALLADHTLPEEAQKLLSLAESSSRNLLHVINYVLDISKLEIGEAVLDPTLFNLPAALKSVTDIVRARAVEKGLELHWRSNPQLHDVYIGDKGKLRQCLLNLAINAIKFTDSGSVTISALPSMQGKTGRVRFEVEDTGIGINEADQTQIFEPFWTGSDKLPVAERGTGLGLDIVRRNVEVLEGELGVISRPGKGSIFWFEIPLEASEGTPADRENPPAERSIPSRFRGRVLLVDDNATNLLLGRMILESLGLEVEEATDGQSAVSRAHDEPFDLVLMDISMPGMDGVTATSEIRKFASREELPVVALTAFASSEERERCLHTGMNEYLTKPIVRERLAEQLATWLQAEGAAPDQAAEETSPLPDATPLVTEPDLNESVLAELRRQIGEANLGTVLAQFTSEVESRWSAFCQAFDAGDGERVTREAHTLSSTCRSLGLIAAGDNFSAIEEHLRAAGDLADVDVTEAGRKLEAGLEALATFRTGA